MGISIERYKPILQSIRKRHGSGVEGLVRSKISLFTDALFSDPDFKDFNSDQKHEFVYRQTKLLESEMFTVRRISDIGLESLIVSCLPSKNDEPYYSSVKYKFLEMYKA